jgi:hypothetical protein
VAARWPYSRSVFINCPFSPEYQPIFRAILFAVFTCGYQPRCALEIADSSANRLSKIEGIIRQCQFGIHDISFMKLDKKTKLPRFNMPLELGMFLAAKGFGRGQQKRKVALILDEDSFRYRAALSDLSGQDIANHKGQERLTIREVRDWLDASHRGKASLPGGDYIWLQYRKFSKYLPVASADQKLDFRKLTYADICRAIESWLETNA